MFDNAYLLSRNADLFYKVNTESSSPERATYSVQGDGKVISDYMVAKEILKPATPLWDRRLISYRLSYPSPVKANRSR